MPIFPFSDSILLGCIGTSSLMNDVMSFQIILKIRTKIKKNKKNPLGIAINNQKRNLICRAPHQSPIYLACIGLTNFIISELWKIHSYLRKIKRKDYLKTGVELKLFERKPDFWNLFENWSLENYLKIGVLGIKLKNWNFGN